MNGKRIRYQQSGQFHFLTFSCHSRRPYFMPAAVMDLFEDALERARCRYLFAVAGYVVMPEHVHLLVNEPRRALLSRAIQALKLSLTEAYVGRSLLESAGIPAWVADENLVRMDWFYSNLIGGMRLQVDERDEVAAREILEEGSPRTITYGPGEVYVQPTCPKCGSTEITLGSGTERGRSLVALYALAIPVPPRKASWHCEACGTQWADAGNGELLR